MTESTDEQQLEVLKELVNEIRSLNHRVSSLENENSTLRKQMEDPEMLMRKHGWQKFTTPHAEETFDPLNRQTGDNSMVFPFEGSGSTILKSRDQQINEWREAEELLKGGQ